MSDPLPTHWYIFFGVVEPVSVLAGCYYATFLPEKYHFELVPPGFLAQSQVQGLLKDGAHLSDNARMVLGQLGSCYFLIMLNSLLMFYSLRKFLGRKNPAALESILYYLFAVLGIADWTHILITILLLPNGPPKRDGLLTRKPASFVDKLGLLSEPNNWNSLLFGNIMITFILFCFRALWWIGVARGSPLAEERRKSKSKTH